MVGASKILTVSYGTFSCTLEGFDEPFSTMKAIAEYFRDLAADDRYFGATPPTPDADMLHRIAEREIQRRVEAKISDHGVVLRPEPSDTAPAEFVAAPMPETTAPVAAEAPARPSIPESVAQKLMRIRAVVSEEAKAEAHRDPVPDAETVPYEEDEATEEFAAAAAPASDFGFDLDFGDMPGLKADAGDVDVDATPAEVAFEDNSFDDEEAEPIVAADAVEPIQVEAEAEFEAEVATEVEVAADVVAEVEVEAESEVDAVAEVEAEAETHEMVEPQSDEEGIVAFGATEDFDDTLTVEAAEADEGAEDIAEDTEVSVDAVAADEETTADEDEGLDEDAQPLDLSAFADAPEEEIAASVEAEAEFEPEAEVDAPRARVIRIDRASTEDYDEDDTDEVGSFDLPEDAPLEDRTAAVLAALSEKAYDDEDFEEVAEATDAEAEDNDILAQIGAAIGDTGLPDQEEEELLRDLADVARDLRRDSHEGRAILESASEDDEASVARLMEEAKSKLEGPENRRRFSAIAHLKAAVAATVADRKMKSGDAGVGARDVPGDDTERYRDDLSKAVRPRRPTSDSIPVTQRPTISTRMAPLVLVSEQRIDLSDETRPETAVVRPRRISAVVRNDIDEDDIVENDDVPLNPEDARSFAEFAERLGASSLPDLLEAAAAYTSTVEGITHFSRPQIIKKVACMAEDEDYSQEDRLRSFGMLLRQGKIQKVRRGQFMLSEASRFMDEARRAGQ